MPLLLVISEGGAIIRYTLLGLRELRDEILLHIGTEKTGTTLLQKWPLANEEQLGARGFWMPQSFGSPNHRRLVAFFSGRLDDWAKINGVASLQEKSQFLADLPENFGEEVLSARASHQACIITRKHFHSRLREEGELQNLRIFLGNHFEEVKVVCYFRNQFDMARSFYSTTLKAAGTQSPHKFFKTITPENYYFNHLAVANNWSKGFGSDNCIFRIYDREKFRLGDLRKDFMCSLDPDFDHDFLEYKVVSENTSLSWLQGAAFREINKSEEFWLSEKGPVNPVKKRLKDKILQVRELEGQPFSEGGGAAVEERFAECNAAFFAITLIQKIYFCRPNHPATSKPMWTCRCRMYL